VNPFVSTVLEYIPALIVAIAAIAMPLSLHKIDEGHVGFKYVLKAMPSWSLVKPFHDISDLLYLLDRRIVV
jgi:hypothetical protein